MYLFTDILFPLLIYGQCHLLGRHTAKATLVDLRNNYDHYVDEGFNELESEGFISDNMVTTDKRVDNNLSSVSERELISSVPKESSTSNIRRNLLDKSSNEMDDLASRRGTSSILPDRQNKIQRRFKAFKRNENVAAKSTDTDGALKKPLKKNKKVGKQCAKLLSKVHAMNQDCKGPPEIPIELGSPVNGNSYSHHSAAVDADCRKLLTAAWKQQVKNCQQSSNEPPPAIPIELGSPVAPKNDKGGNAKQSGSSGCEKLKALTESKLKNCKQSDENTPPSIPIELGAAAVDKITNKQAGGREKSNSKECEELTALINKKLQKCKQTNSEPPPSIPIELGSAMVGEDNKNNPSENDNGKSKECEELQALVNKKLEKCKQANSEPPPSIPIELGSPVVGKKGKGQSDSTAKGGEAKECPELSKSMDKDPQKCKQANNEPPPAIPIELGSAMVGKNGKPKPGTAQKNDESKDCQELGATMDKDPKKCKQANNEPPPAIPIELGSAIVGKNGKTKPGTSQKNEESKDCDKETAGSIDKELEKCKQTNNEPPPAIPIELGSAVVDKTQKQNPSGKQKAGDDKECNKEIAATANKKLYKCQQQKNDEAAAVPIEPTSAVHTNQPKLNEKKQQPLPLTNKAKGFVDAQENQISSAVVVNGARRDSAKDEQTSHESQPSRDASEDYEPVAPPKVPIELGSAASPNPHKFHTPTKTEHAKSKKRSDQRKETSHKKSPGHKSRMRRSISIETKRLSESKVNGDDISSENLMYLNEIEEKVEPFPSSKILEVAAERRRFNRTNSDQVVEVRSEPNDSTIDHSHSSSPVQILSIPDEPSLKTSEKATPIPGGNGRNAKAFPETSNEIVESMTQSGEMEGSGVSSGYGSDVLTPGDDEWSTSSLDVTSGASEEIGSTPALYSGDAESFSGSGSGSLPAMPSKATRTRFKRGVVDLDDDSVGNAELAHSHKEHGHGSQSTKRKGKKSSKKKSKKHKRKNNKLKMIAGGHLKEILSANLKDPDVKKYILQMSSNVRTVVGQARNVLFSTGQVVHGLRKVISGAGKLSEFAENAVKYANYFARDPDNATIDFLEEKAVIAVLEAQKAAHDAKLEASRAKIAAGKALSAAKRALISGKDHSKIEKYAKLAEKAKKKAILAAKRAGEKAKVVKKDALVVDEELRKIINSLPSGKIKEHKHFHNTKNIEIKDLNNSTESGADSTPLSEEENLGVSPAAGSQATDVSMTTEPGNFASAENKTFVKETEDIPKDEESSSSDNNENETVKGINEGNEVETNEVKDTADQMVQINSLKDEQQGPGLMERTNVTIVSVKPEMNETDDSLEDIAKNLISAIDKTKYGANATGVGKEAAPVVAPVAVPAPAPAIDYTVPGGDENYVVADDYRRANTTVSKEVIPKTDTESIVKSNNWKQNSTTPTKVRSKSRSFGRPFKYPVSNIRRFLPMRPYPLVSTFQKAENTNADHGISSQKATTHQYAGRTRAKVSELPQQMAYNVPDYIVRTGNVPLHPMHYLEGYRGFGDALRRDGLIGLEPRADAPVTQDYHTSIKRGQIEEPIYRMTVDPYLSTKDTILYPYGYGPLSALNVPRRKHTVAKEILKSKK